MRDDWRWQMENAIRSEAALSERLELTEGERCGLRIAADQGPPLLITPYYFGLIDGDDRRDPIRAQCVPRAGEGVLSSALVADPLAEVKHRVAPALVRRYPDRALFLVTDRCATNCRHCTRRRRIGQRRPRSIEELEPALQWLEQHHDVREVLISGGDPLVASDDWVGMILERIRSIPSLEIIRIGTRTPVTLPQRITPRLCEILRSLGPLYVMTHFNHPREVTERSMEACALLADSGIPLANQAVLLRGVNDSAEVQSELGRRLLQARVRPYYLMQCDAVRGTAHFRTNISRGLQIMATLRERLTGLAIPTFVLDLPGGAGKVPLTPEYLVERRGERVLFRGLAGEIVEYEDREDHSDDEVSLRENDAFPSRCDDSPVEDEA